MRLQIRLKRRMYNPPRALLSRNPPSPVGRPFVKDGERARSYLYDLFKWYERLEAREMERVGKAARNWFGERAVVYRAL